MQPNQLPVYPQNVHFSLHGRGVNGIIPISRYQLPLICAHCVSTYKVQGDTLDAAIGDLNLPPPPNNDAKNYIENIVWMSRVKNLSDLLIMSDFPSSIILNSKPSKALVAEMDRLTILWNKLKHKYTNDADVYNTYEYIK